jgi:GrpB-like predicted nucleotidyltransferase (UPF0157 family)
MNTSASGHVELARYDPSWPIAFTSEAENLLAQAQGLIVCIEHIGSTSVPGLVAKPVIDLMAEVANVPLDPEPLIPILEPLCYLHRSGGHTQ